MTDESHWRSIKVISDIAPGTIIVSRGKYRTTGLRSQTAMDRIARYAVVIKIFCTGTKQLLADDGKVTIHPVNVVKILYISGGIDYIRDVHMFAKWNKIVE